MIYAWLVPKVIFPLHDLLSGQKTWQTTCQLNEMQWRTRRELEDRALNKIRDLLAYAQAKVPYYRDQFRQTGMGSRDICSLSDLSRIPHLTKAAVRKHHQGSLLAQGVPSGARIEAFTSGSTGQPLHFFLDRRAEGLVRAGLLHFRQQAGIETWDAMFWLAHPDHLLASLRHPSWLASKARRYLLGEIFHSGGGPDCLPSALEDFAKNLPGSRNYFIFGFPSYLCGLARKIGVRSKKLDIQPKAIVTYAETLEPQMAESLRNIFGCPVFNLYSSFEVRYLAQTCPDHPQYLHINTERCLLRVVDDQGRDCPPGTPGRVLVTDLHNRVMPLINYELNDVAVMGPSCPCGRGFPTLSAIHGRANEAVKTLDGRIIAPSTFGKFLFYKHDYRKLIFDYQFHQTSPDEVILRVVASPELAPKQEKQLARDLQNFLGRAMNVKLQLMDTLATDNFGKRPVVISELLDQCETANRCGRQS